MRPILTTLALMAVMVSGLGAGSCGSNKQEGSTPEQQRKDAEAVVSGIATGFVVAADSIEQGIPIVRQFRLAGKIKPAQSLKAARTTKRIVEIMISVSDALMRFDAMADTERRNILDDVGELVKLADEIKGITFTDSAGKTSNAQIIFGLGVLAAGSSLQIAATRFRDKLPPGFQIPVTPEARAQFEAARPVLVRDLAALDAAIVELSQL